MDSAHVTGMVSRMGEVSTPSGPPGATPPSASGARGSRHHLPIEFTGSGSEYFRIWIVNLLLTLLTLGIYQPWAKARRLRYFYGNTEVGGHPLGFHAEPRRMFRGAMLVGVLLVAYSMAQEVSAFAGSLAFLALAALTPALFKSAQQFRMANTSWRGLRLRFTGELAGAYRAFLPLMLPGAVLVFATVPLGDADKLPGWFGWAVLAAFVVGLILLPRWWWSLKQYQHGNFALGEMRTELRAGVTPFYMLWLKTYGLVLLSAVAGLALAFALGIWSPRSQWTRGSGGALVLVMMLLTTLAVVGVIVQIVVTSYFVARHQNVVWSRTGNPHLRFKSELSYRDYLGLTVKNWLLVVITLGLYWPFAAVAVARMRLEAITVISRVDPDTLISLARPREGEAAGDAAADLFGFDPGL